MSLQLFLDGNTWKGGEFPEGDYYSNPVASARASALEVVNPEMLSPKIFKFPGGYGIQIGKLDAETVKPGVLYPWDGGAEIGEHEECGHPCEDYKDVCQHYGCAYKGRKFLRLLPKAPVKDKYELWMNGEWKEVGNDAYLQGINNNHYGRVNGVPHNGESPKGAGDDYPVTLPKEDAKPSNHPEKHSKVSGIAAIGVPECNETISDMKEDLLPNQKNKGHKKRAEWLSYCLSIGWKNDQLDDLQKIWDQHHDEAGNLVQSAPVNDAGGGREYLIEAIEEAMERERNASEEHHPTGYYLGLEAAIKIISYRPSPQAEGQDTLWSEMYTRCTNSQGHLQLDLVKKLFTITRKP